LLKGKTATALVGFALVGTAGTWAAVSYAVPAIPLILSSASYERAKLDQPQISNSDAKGDRLAFATVAEPYEAARPERLLLDDAQISALRSRLKLSPTQEEFWPAVEVTLRNVVRQHARKTPKNGRGAPPPIDVNSPEVQQLISAAVPLIMRMSEAQKHEVRQLARIIGLHTVASRI
jgi:hypothetical protein